MNSNINKTTDAELSNEMRTFYSAYLIDNAAPRMVHDQFGQKHPIPKGGGKTIQFRKYSPLPKALTPLTEGVTPDGQKLSVSTVEATVRQYGRYIEMSDMLQLTAVDNNILQATKLLGNQAGATLDTITREVLNGGTNVQFAEGQVAARHLLTGGKSEGNHYMTVDAIRRAARYLKTQNAEKIGDSYVAIIHPDIAYDLMNDPQWQNVKTYCDPKDMYAGEIGRLAGVRFVETTEAKIFKGAPLSQGASALTVAIAAASGSTVVSVKETLTEADAAALAGRDVLIQGKKYRVASASAGTGGAATLLLETPAVQAKEDKVYPGEGGAEGRAVYSTLVLGDNAYGVTEIEGGGLRHIVKQLGSSGTADPLDQRGSCGWKATRTAERLVESFMVRIETTSTFDGEAN
ncbi:MAG: N4-gp56 family major capsid protein [Butyricicoccaceae bacterium]